MAVYIDYADVESVDVSESNGISPNRFHCSVNKGQDEPCIVIDDDDTDELEIQHNVISSVQSSILKTAAGEDDDCQIVGISTEDQDAPTPVGSSRNRISEHPEFELDLRYGEGDHGKVVNCAIPTGIYSNIGVKDGLPHAAKPTPPRGKHAKKFYCLECRAVCFEDHEHSRPEAEIPSLKVRSQKYSCSVCDKKFANLNDYLKHCQVCQVYAKCEHCDEVFADVRFLEEHVTNVHDQDTQVVISSSLEEAECSFTTSSIVSQESEREFEPVSSSSSGLLFSSLSYQCPYCNAVLEGGEVFDSHIRGHDPNVNEMKLEQLRYHTQILDSGGLRVNIKDLETGRQERKMKNSNRAQTSSNNNRRNHTKNETKTVNSTSVSKNQKSNKRVRKKYNKSSSRARGKAKETIPVIPRVKPNLTPEIKSLRLKSIVHTSEGRVFRCQDCGYENREWSRCLKHIRRKICLGRRKPKRRTTRNKIADDGFLKCPDCDRKFLYLYNLERHRAVHTKTIEDRCSVCFAIFSSSGDLDNHMKKFHSDPKAQPETDQS